MHRLLSASVGAGIIACVALAGCASGGPASTIVSSANAGDAVITFANSSDRQSFTILQSAPDSHVAGVDGATLMLFTRVGGATGAQVAIDRFGNLGVQGDIFSSLPPVPGGTQPVPDAIALLQTIPAQLYRVQSDPTGIVKVGSRPDDHRFGRAEDTSRWSGFDLTSSVAIDTAATLELSKEVAELRREVDELKRELHGR